MPFDASPSETKPDTPVLDPVIKREWVDTLRSGKYRQIRGDLSNGKNGRCVMGVFYAISTVHAKSAAFWKEDTVQSLASRNDTGESFASLANWIEANL